MTGGNFTPTIIRALKECPQGQQPGTIFEVTADVADILVSYQLAERIADPLAPKGTYKRRDLTAEKR